MTSTNPTPLPQPTLDAVIDIAKQAGQAIMTIYARDFEITDKADLSPLTEADLASHHCIENALNALTPQIPVLSEESKDSAISERLSWNRYWLIDPLDGTKEFIKKNGEFTVNIALIDNHQPVFGVVYAPALGVCYWGAKSHGAFKQQDNHKIEAIAVGKAPGSATGWRIVGSRSHQSEEFKQFAAKFDAPEILSMGSSLKLCLVAEGSADIYPRLGLTSEWDTAAAQAVVEAAGGQVLEHPNLTPLLYNSRPETLLNPFFIVCASKDPVWSEL